jgi:hypothetical protein
MQIRERFGRIDERYPELASNIGTIGMLLALGLASQTGPGERVVDATNERICQAVSIATSATSDVLSSALGMEAGSGYSGGDVCSFRPVDLGNIEWSRSHEVAD